LRLPAVIDGSRHRKAYRPADQLAVNARRRNARTLGAVPFLFRQPEASRYTTSLFRFGTTFMRRKAQRLAAHGAGTLATAENKLESAG
jgi:hypothetical protein